MFPPNANHHQTPHVFNATTVYAMSNLSISQGTWPCRLRGQFEQGPDDVVSIVLLAKCARCRSASRRAKRTGLGLLSTLCVALCVNVVWMDGIGNHVFAIGTELVGYCGFAPFAVTLVPGTGCMGAYRVAPVCMA
jgi:hypothetical protein